MYEINEVFELQKKKYKIVPEKQGICSECAGDNNSLCGKFPECQSYKRSDNTDVIFVDVDCKDMELMHYFHSEIEYRSKPNMVNMENDMVKVEFRIPRMKWSKIKNSL